MAVVHNCRRGRFAPTPSGPLHIGNASTALAAWLQMRHAGGVVVLRIEDIDRRRTSPEYEASAIDDLRWLGLDWDEGPDVGGPHGPYRQSERSALYREAYERLDAAGLLYPCFCTRTDIAATARAPHGLSSEGPIYPGTCKNLTADERAKRAVTKDPSARFAVDGAVNFVDAVHGQQRFLPEQIGDFVVRRADGLFGYQLAVVVDDALMGISDVLRGDDLLGSTARQIHLYRALGWHVPQFAHVPLLVQPDGSRLSKSQRAIAIRELRATGAQPEQIVGQLAYGLGLIDHPQPIRAVDLVSQFDTKRLPVDPIRADPRWTPTDQ